MSGQTFGEFVNEWQNGVLLLVAALVVGAVPAAIVSQFGPAVKLLAFATGVAGAFVAISYLLPLTTVAVSEWNATGVPERRRGRAGLPRQSVPSSVSIRRAQRVGSTAARGLPRAEGP